MNFLQHSPQIRSAEPRDQQMWQLFCQIPQKMWCKGNNTIQGSENGAIVRSHLNWENARGPGAWYSHASWPGTGRRTPREGTSTPLRAGTVLLAKTLPHPSCTSLGRGKEQGVPAREGVPARGFLELWAVWAWDYRKPGPPNEPDPSPLLINRLSAWCRCEAKSVCTLWS